MKCLVADRKNYKISVNYSQIIGTKACLFKMEHEWKVSTKLQNSRKPLRQVMVLNACQCSYTIILLCCSFYTSSHLQINHDINFIRIIVSTHTEI